MKTPWFKAETQFPVRIGAYEVDDKLFKYWDGRQWGPFAQTPQQAKEYATDEWSSQIRFHWRGLLKESK
jgi:hypothetical protein